MDNKIDTTCEHIRLRLIAAAIGLQQCTKTSSNVIPIQGTERVIVIGTPAEAMDVLAAQLAPAAETNIAEDVAALFGACGFEIRSTDPAEKHPLAVAGSLDAAGLVVEALLTRQQAGAPIDALSDDDLWHIVGIVNTLAGGSLLNLSQYDCVTAIRAGFMDPDSGREYEKARAAALEGAAS